MGLELEIVPDDVAASVRVGLVDVELAVQTAGTYQGRVEHVGTVGRADDEHKRLRRNGTADEPEPAGDLVLHTVLDVLSERVHLVEHGVEGQAAAAHHPHRAHLRLLAAHPTACQTDRIQLVQEQDAAARLARCGVLPCEAAGLSEERDDHQDVHAHEHSSDARCVNVDEGQVGFGRHHAGEEGLAGARWPGEEHARGHLATAVLERLHALENAHQAPRVVEQIGLPAVILKREADLRLIRRDGIGTRPRHEPHQDAELHDHHERVEEQQNEQLRRLPDHVQDPLEDAADAVEADRGTDDDEQDQQPFLVVIQHVRRVAECRLHARHLVHPNDLVAGHAQDESDEDVRAIAGASARDICGESATVLLHRAYELHTADVGQRLNRGLKLLQDLHVQLVRQPLRVVARQRSCDVGRDGRLRRAREAGVRIGVGALTIPPRKVARINAARALSIAPLPRPPATFIAPPPGASPVVTGPPTGTTALLNTHDLAANDRERQREELVLAAPGLDLDRVDVHAQPAG